MYSFKQNTPGQYLLLCSSDQTRKVGFKTRQTALECSSGVSEWVDRRRVSEGLRINGFPLTSQ